MAAAEKRELLRLLEEKHRRRARDDLNAYCRYIEIPGVPVNDDPDCEEFYPDSVTPAAHHELINNALMKMERGELPRLMVFMPPGSAKSTYGTVTAPTWFMGRKPGRNIICTSHTSELAARFGRRCRQITRSAKYNQVFDHSLQSDNKAADDWSLSNGSTYIAGGILTGMAGNRADFLFIDDPLRGRQDADSETIRNKLWEEYRANLRTRLKPRGGICIIQTRWHEDDLAGRILQKTWDGESGWIKSRDGEMWFVICLPAQCDNDTDPLGRKRGDWLWTEWFSQEHWEQEKITQGSRNWDSLYQQKPKPSEGGTFKRPWVKRYRTPPVDGIIMQSWDTGNKPNELNDPSVCTTWLVTDLYWYLLHVWRDRVDFPTLLHTVKNHAVTWKPMGIIIEDKASGTQLIQTLRASTNLSVIPFDPTPHGDKVIRAQNVSPLVESGRVLLPEEAPWLIDFESEFFSFPLSTKKDQVDSVSQFLKWAHRECMGIEAYGTGQRTSHDAYGSQGSHLDINHGFGTVRSDTDTSDF